ncbi:DHA2 family efflux MFS transporter permease subunit [Sciscionella marina]|uniref:DHA2 family efflux MFS transporter permease subunit n=1 Tax=Sciscionella marina TaxID=508770 RepID=UPI0009FD5C8F|nr:DHA2 family efflux MFS transporter permease subunit [Sciscionella marina]
MRTESERSPWPALAALCLGFFMIMIDTSIVMVAIPDLMREINASLNEVTWVTSAYVLGWAVPLLASGRLGDRYGRRRIFLAGIVVFTLASAWCGLSGNPEMLIAARAAQGIGAALITPQTLSFITHLFPAGKRGAAMGVWGAVAGLGNIAGPLLGGLLVGSLGWEWIFFVNLPIGIVCVLMTLALVPPWRPGTKHSFDLTGIALSGVGLFFLIFGIQNGQQYEWGTVFAGITITEIIAAGVVLLIAFAIWQHFNKREPLVPLGLFRSRNFAIGNLAQIMLGICLAGAMLPLVIYLQAVLGLTPLQAGLMLAPSALMSGIIAPFIGKRTDGPAAKYIGAFGFAAMAAGYAIVALIAAPQSSPWALIPGIVVLGVGLGCVFTPLTNLSISTVPPHQIGSGSGVFNAFRQVGTVLGTASVGVLLQARLVASMHSTATQAAGALPAGERAGFIAGMDKAAQAGADAGAGGGGPAGGIGGQVFGTAFTEAATSSLWLPIGALALGAVLCLFFGARQPVSPAAAPPRVEHADVA